MKATRQEMPETMYRVSRCCRVLGNPTAYLIVRALFEGKFTPTELSEKLKIPLYTISITLRHLRQVDLVRYKTAGQNKIYWVKDSEISRLLVSFEHWVDKERSRKK